MFLVQLFHSELLEWEQIEMSHNCGCAASSRVGRELLDLLMHPVTQLLTD